MEKCISCGQECVDIKYFGEEPMCKECYQAEMEYVDRTGFGHDGMLRD